MGRFDIVVFNYERISLFTGNFHKLVGFSRGQDRILIYDCSEHFETQLSLVRQFCRERSLEYGIDLHLLRRENWGIEQGARMDYAQHLRADGCKSKYIWQIQEHYLDVDSPASRWPAHTINVDGQNFSGQIKSDCVPDDFCIDLDHCQTLLEDEQDVVLYADRIGIGYFPYLSEPFFCIDGGNFCCSAELFRRIVDESTTSHLKTRFDGSYEWALYAEHYLGLRTSRCSRRFHDLHAGISFSTIEELVEAQINSSKKVFHVSEEYYAVLFSRGAKATEGWSSDSRRLGVALGTQQLRLTDRLNESEADRAARLKAIEALTDQLNESEADRAARLEVINRLKAELQEAARTLNAPHLLLWQIGVAILARAKGLALRFKIIRN
jgi:hypothetical protein